MSKSKVGFARPPKYKVEESKRLIREWMARLRASALYEVLQHVEVCGRSADGIQSCPCCGCHVDAVSGKTTHKSDCLLGMALTEYSHEHEFIG